MWTAAEGDTSFRVALMQVARTREVTTAISATARTDGLGVDSMEALIAAAV
jgi:hypothetical protein